MYFIIIIGRLDFHLHPIFQKMCIRDRGPGLWTSMVEPYYRHFELIQDIFSFQNLNDHQNASLHQPLLVSRKDLGISDEDWYPLRGRCWVQNSWSATITPKGAFFCEVAGALDMLLDVYKRQLPLQHLRFSLHLLRPRG